MIKKTARYKSDMKFRLVGGFTLVEVLLSLVILSVGVLALSTNIGKGMQTTYDIKTQRDVRMVTSQALEYFYALNSIDDNLMMQNKLKNFDITAMSMESVDLISQDISVSLSQATDSNGVDIRLSDVLVWKKPYTLVYSISVPNEAEVKISQVLP